MQTAFQPKLEPIQLKRKEPLLGSSSAKAKIDSYIRWDPLEHNVFYTLSRDPYADNGAGKSYEVKNVMAPNLFGIATPKWGSPPPPPRSARAEKETPVRDFWDYY